MTCSHGDGSVNQRSARENGNCCEATIANTFTTSMPISKRNTTLPPNIPRSQHDCEKNSVRGPINSIPRGLTAGGLSKAASDYFDFYLDGKPPTRARVKPPGDNPAQDKQQRSTSAAGITPWQLRNGEFTRTDEGLLISRSSKGRQSAFLTRNGIRLTGPVAVELTVRTETEGPITVSWRTKETPAFTSANRVDIGVEQVGKWQDLKATIANSSEIIHVRVQFPGRKVIVRNLQLRPSAGNPVTLRN
jgi:hypothetical protein